MFPHFSRDERLVLLRRSSFACLHEALFSAEFVAPLFWHTLVSFL